MERIEIEQYKGQTIEYDIENNKFVCDITIQDRDKTTSRQSLKDVRKEIDTFIKLNLEFKPFKVFQKRSYGLELEVINVEGIRTDGKFTCKNERYPNSRGFELIDFEKEMRSGDEFYEYDADIIKEKKQIEAEEEKYRKIIQEKEKALFKKLKKLNLKPYKIYTDAFKEK